MANNEWPMLGLSIIHCFEIGVDHVVVLNHASDDGTARGLSSLKKAWPGRITVLTSGDKPFFQEAATAVVARIVHAADFEWVYVFDADEFLVLPRDTSLRDILAKIPSSIGAVRYAIDQWVAPSDLNEKEAFDFSRIVYRAIPKELVGISREQEVDFIRKGLLNFFDIRMISKVIVRGNLMGFLGPGCHVVRQESNTEEFTIDHSMLVCAHVPFRSRTHLERKKTQGARLLADGFGRRHGWQSQMLVNFDEGNHLDWFWQRHSVPSRQQPLLNEPAGYFSAEMDFSLSRIVLRVARKLLLVIGDEGGEVEPAFEDIEQTMVSLGDTITIVHEWGNRGKPGVK